MSTNEPIYLDHAATTPLAPEVLESMQPYLTGVFGNPSSLHRWGRSTRQAVANAREAIADCIGAHPEELFFTSGGTESDNLVILGVSQAMAHKGRHVMVSAIEHPAVMEPARTLERKGWDVTYLPVDSEGFVSVETVEASLRPDTVLVSVMHGNNEVGTLQPIEAIGQLLREKQIAFHVDAVQTVGKLPMDLHTLPVDYLSISSHKLYGPKGIGALYCRSSAVKPSPLQFGGGQEEGLRSGTENVAAIVGFAKALSMCVDAMADETPRLRQLQEALITGIVGSVPSAVLNGPRDLSQRVPGNVNVSFPPHEGESLVVKLDMRGFAVSSGSACHSAKLEPSAVLLALGKPEEIARSSVRFSLGRSTTQDAIDKLVAVLPVIAHAGKSGAAKATVVQ